MSISSRPSKCRLLPKYGRSREYLQPPRYHWLIPASSVPFPPSASAIDLAYVSRSTRLDQGCLDHLHQSNSFSKYSEFWLQNQSPGFRRVGSSLRRSLSFSAIKVVLLKGLVATTGRAAANLAVRRTKDMLIMFAGFVALFVDCSVENAY